MASIIGIHGVGNQFKGEAMLRAEWLPAIKDGIARTGQRLTSDEDFDCVFYGDVFRPVGKAAVDPPFDASDLNGEWEQALLEMWWHEAARIDPAVRRLEDKTKFSTPNFFQRALDALSQSSFFAGLAERALIYDLKQVSRYFNEPEIRQACRARIERAINQDTEVVIAHSLGSVIAYETLCLHPDSPVRTFVTIGSPLGITNLIFEKLNPRPRNRLGVWPGQVKSWVNIADEGDVVALVKQLATRFGQQVKDHIVNNGAKAHDALRYLTSKELGEAIVSKP